MDEIPGGGKENVIDTIYCSPVLSSSQESAPRPKRILSPLTILGNSQLDNTLNSPCTEVSTKAPRFISTPLHRRLSFRTSRSTWDEIRKLDEEEVWIERTQVLTKEEHFLYCEVAKKIVYSIIEDLPLKIMENSGNPETEGLNFDDNAANTTVSDEKEDQIENNQDDEAAAPAETSVQSVPDEKEENVPTDMKTIELDADSIQLPSQTMDKSVLEDNDFISSCSELDVTVKEILADEEQISPKKFEDLDDTSSDAEKTIYNIQIGEFPDPDSVQEALQTQFDDDSFKPASGAAFALELDYLESLGSSNDAEHTSDLARQSLYVKFDPLVQAREKEAPEQETSSLSKVNPEDLLFPGPISGSDLLVMDTPPKRSAQVHTTLAQLANDEQKHGENDTSATGPVDHLFNFSPAQQSADDKPESDDMKKHDESVTQGDSSLVQPLLHSSKDLEKAVEQERERLTAQWKEESGLLEFEIKEQASKIERLMTEKNKAVAEIHEMKAVMLEYEQTMAQMIEDREKDKSQHEKSNLEIMQERDQLHHDLNNTEKSFAHLHARFEKLKSAVEGYRKNEEILKKAVKDLQENVKKSDGMYQRLKAHAEEKIHEANVEISRVQTTNKAEVAALQAALKRERAKNASLQQNLEQKISENKELTSICDELINKVGMAR